jgi:hypothetical protein
MTSRIPRIPRIPRIGRRSFLRTSLAASAAAFPLLPSLRVRAQAAAFPTRLIVMHSPNGIVPPAFRPQGGETDFQLGRVLAPLEKHRARLIVLGGINMPFAESGPGSHHARGLGGLLTGRLIQTGDFATFGGTMSGWANGISIDQHIAQTLAPPTPFKTFELGVRILNSDVRGHLSYLGPAQPVPPLESPYDAFDRLFASVAMPGAQADRVRSARRSVLDFLEQELSSAQRALGAEDRAKLDEHLTSLRDIEGRLVPQNAAPSTCTPPGLGTRIDIAANENMADVGRLQLDIAAAALACDLTRIVTVQWSHPEADQTYPFIGVNAPHHATSHAGDTDADAQESLTKIDVWYAEQMAYLADKLASYSEGDATLLDHSVVMWASEISKGNVHGHTDLPFALIGSAGGYFRTGRFVDFAKGGAMGRPHNDLLVSLANALGTTDRSFGDPAYSTGPLDELR